MIPLEDNFSDIISKAQRGLRLSDTELAERARVNSQTIRKLREGEFDELALSRIAPVLGLAARALSELAAGGWQPKTVPKLEGFAQLHTHYHDMGVNSYRIWDPKSKEAAVFDTGGDCAEMLRVVADEKLDIKLILLTHGHADHIAALAQLKLKTQAPVYVSEREEVSGAQPIEEGKAFCIGKIDIDTRLTWGHSRGGLTYVVNGLARKLAIVGDSLFAGSMGG